MIRPTLALATLLSAAVLLSSVGFIVAFAVAVPRTQARHLSAKIPLFQFEGQAQIHCPKDSIVWANAGNHMYNTNGERWYGRTSTGAYGCLHEAEKAGYRAQRAGR